MQEQMKRRTIELGNERGGESANINTPSVNELTQKPRSRTK